MFRWFSVVVLIITACSPIRGSQSPLNTPISAKQLGIFPGAPFATVKAFAYNLDPDQPPRTCPQGLLLKDGSLCPDIDDDGVALSTDLTQQLLSLTFAKSTWNDETSKCFFPRHSFVFYNENNTPFAELRVCFECNMVRAAPAIPAMDHGYAAFTVKGAQALATLCERAGLPNCWEHVERPL